MTDRKVKGSGSPREMTPAEIDLLAALALKIQSRYPAGLPTWTPQQVDTITDDMLDAYPNAGPVDDTIGLAFTTRALAQYWGRSPASIRRQAQAGRLLALKAANGTYLYPVLQLDNSGNVVDGLADVIAALITSMPDHWDIARWLATAPAEPSPIRLLHDNEIAVALTRAQQVARESCQRTRDAIV